MLRALVTSGKLRGPASVPRQQGADGADLLMGKANSEDFVPSLAYGITGSNNDTDRIYRLLLATYHPRNYYAVHIDDAESALALRTKLAAHPVLAATVAVGAAEAAGSGEYVTVTGGAGRIHVIMDPEMVTVEGGSHLAVLLRLAHTLLRMGEGEAEGDGGERGREGEGDGGRGERGGGGWGEGGREEEGDGGERAGAMEPKKGAQKSIGGGTRGQASGWQWLVLLGAEDYPLVTQDELLWLLSSASPRLSFMDHVVDHRFDYRQESAFADNALFEGRRGGRWIADVRDRVTRFEVYTGSFPLIASQPFIRYLIDEPHAVPRRMLMFLGDTLSPHLHYLSTAACQSARFNHTVVNSGLHFPPFTVTQGHEVPPVNASVWQNLTGKGASGGGVFLFVHDPDPGLIDEIDRELLHREEASVVDCRVECTSTVQQTAQHNTAKTSVHSLLQPSQRVTELRRELQRTIINNRPCEV
ncbi:hypothetical protein CLOM_g6233 [Closterium sp. NIES-68]|nr:hypothetical protein CLOM_g6233 [Closterium sp. NIES-68]